MFAEYIRYIFLSKHFATNLNIDWIINEPLTVPRGVSILENHLLEAFLDRWGITSHTDLTSGGRQDKNQYTREFIRKRELRKWSLRKKITFANKHENKLIMQCTVLYKQNKPCI